MTSLHDLHINGAALIIRDRDRVPHHVRRVGQRIYEVSRPPRLGGIDRIVVCAGSAARVAEYIEEITQ